MVTKGHPGPSRARTWFHLTASSSARCIWSCRRLSFFSASWTTRASLVVLSDEGVGALRDAFIGDPWVAEPSRKDACSRSACNEGGQSAYNQSPSHLLEGVLARALVEHEVAEETAE